MCKKRSLMWKRLTVGIAFVHFSKLTDSRKMALNKGQTFVSFDADNKTRKVTLGTKIGLKMDKNQT